MNPCLPVFLHFCYVLCYDAMIDILIDIFCCTMLSCSSWHCTLSYYYIVLSYVCYLLISHATIYSCDRIWFTKILGEKHPILLLLILILLEGSITLDSSCFPLNIKLFSSILSLHLSLLYNTLLFSSSLWLGVDSLC